MQLFLSDVSRTTRIFAGAAAMASSSSPPVAARASTPGGVSLTVATYNIGAHTDQMFAGSKGMAFQTKLMFDVRELMKVLAF